MPRFEHEDLDSTQELPTLPEEFEPIGEDPIPDYDYRPVPQPRPQPKPQYPEEYDPDEELPEDFIDVALRVLGDLPGFFRKHQKKILLAACALVLVVLVTTLGLMTTQGKDPYDEKILNNVMIADVLVGGMTKDQAASVLNASLAVKYTTQPMVVDLGEVTIRLEPSQTGAQLNIQAAVDAAYAYGRTGTQAEKDQAYQVSLSSNHIMAVLPYLELNEDAIRSAVDAIGADTVSTLTQPTYILEGDVSNFSTESFNPDNDGQTLVLTLGTPQIDFDSNVLYEKILDAYSLGTFRVEAQGPTTVQEPEVLDLDAIYQEYFLEPKAPTLDMTDFDTIPGAYGRQFDLENAKLLLAQAQPGTEVRIPMTYPAPEGDPASVLYRDTLGTWSTNLPNDENWKQNMRLACNAINGITLKPGEVFSFHAVVGQPSEGRGYLPASTCDGKVADGNIGGGVCQVSSTLYVAALLSDLEVTSRTAHSYPLTFTEWGLDASVQWDGPDMAFRNSSIYPIRLETEFSGGLLTVRIIGTDSRSYRTDMVVSVSESTPAKTIYEEFPYDNVEGYKDGDVIQAGYNGSQVKTYRHKYDKTNGELIGRDYIATSSYPSQDKIVARVAPQVVETEPTLPPSETISGIEGGSEAVG